MIDHKGPCTGEPCTCSEAERKARTEETVGQGAYQRVAEQGRPTCKARTLVYLDGKAEFEWACTLPMLHEGAHQEGRYGWQ